jgi:hypothetical protein
LTNNYDVIIRKEKGAKNKTYLDYASVIYLSQLKQTKHHFKLLEENNQLLVKLALIIHAHFFMNFHSGMATSFFQDAVGHLAGFLAGTHKE